MSLFLVASLTVLGVVAWILWSNGHPPLLVFGACSLVGLSITMKHIELHLAPLEAAAGGARRAGRDFGVARGAWGVTQYAATLATIMAWPFLRAVELALTAWRTLLMALESRVVREGARLALEGWVGAGAGAGGSALRLGEAEVREEALAFVGQIRACTALAIEVVGCLVVLWIVRDACFYSPAILHALLAQHYHRHHA